MKITVGRFDAADFLDDPETEAAYISEAIASGEAALIARALGAVARARNISELSRKTGISRPGLRKALSGEGNPSFETVLKVAKALNIELLKPSSAPAASKPAPRKRLPARAAG